MSFVGQDRPDFDDKGYWEYMQNCTTLSEMLDKAIQCVMHYILQGRCQDADEWESLFRAVSQATFIKDYLSVYQSNLIPLGESFLVQVEGWKQELQTKLR